jgi:hypothetical protein
VTRNNRHQGTLNIATVTGNRLRKHGEDPGAIQTNASEHRASA